MTEEFRITVFDFDHTLVAADSFGLFARYACGLGKFACAIGRSAATLAKWKLGLTSASVAKERLFGELYGGMCASRFESLGSSFAGVLARYENTEMNEMLRRALADGDEVAIATASVRQWVEPWAKGKGVKCVIATEAEVDCRGYLTGSFAGKNCCGAEKARRVREWAAGMAQTGTRVRVRVFTDGYGDEELLKLEGYL